MSQAGPRIELWSNTPALATMPLTFSGGTFMCSQIARIQKYRAASTGAMSPLDSLGLELFVRVHSKPLLQNYSWDVKKQYEARKQRQSLTQPGVERDSRKAIGLAIAVLWLNYSNHTEAMMWDL
eukprot:5911081-Amphidinium_carterae.1